MKCVSSHGFVILQVCKSYWEDYQKFGLPNSRVVFTIHNLNYGAGPSTPPLYHLDARARRQRPSE